MTEANCYGCEHDLENQQGHYGGCINFPDEEEVANVNSDKVLSACDICCHEFRAGDSLYRQYGNEVHNLFELEFCSENCYKNCVEMYPFVGKFKFEETIKQKGNNNVDLILEILELYPRFVFDSKNRRPYKSTKIMNDFITLTQKDNLDNEEKEYISFCKEKKLFLLK